MSRAFVKEDDSNAADDFLPEKPLSDYPYYMTPAGQRQLGQEHQQKLRQRQTLRLQVQAGALSASAELKYLERDLRFLEEVLLRSQVIESHNNSAGDVKFGARVRVADEAGKEHQFTIVGELETCAAQGFISWLSPLASALMGLRAGDSAIWERPNGNAELEILAIDYPELT